MASESEIIRQYKDKEITSKQAGKLLGWTADMVTRVARTGKMPTRRKTHELVTGQAPRATSTSSPAPAASPAAAPGSLDEALKAAAGASPASPQPTEAKPAETKPADQAGGETPPPPPGPNRAYDPDDYDAAKDLIKEGREAMVDNIAEYAYKIDSNDPELEPIKKPGSFMKVAVKRNPEKAAKLGKLFSGWPGLIIATVIEALQIARAVRKLAKKKGLLDPETPPEAKVEGQSVEVERIAPHQDPPPVSTAPKTSLKENADRIMEAGKIPEA